MTLQGRDQIPHDYQACDFCKGLACRAEDGCVSGAQLRDGRWACSPECWERAVDGRPLGARVVWYELHNGILYETGHSVRNPEVGRYAWPVAAKGKNGWRVAEYRDLDEKRDASLMQAIARLET